MALTVSTTVPDDATCAAIVALADVLEREDGSPPLSDQARSLLGSPTPLHAVARDGDVLVGYAQRAGTSLELVALHATAGPLLDAIGSGGTLVWTHGKRSRLVPVLAARGFTRARELNQLRRPLDAAHPLPADPLLADGVAVRHFVQGSDNAAWLALNATAFASHPEQGSWTTADLDARIAEPWFDAAGFLLAERAGVLLGFHWTKVHPDGAGEVYVLGVDPQAQGLGLGQALLVRGLRHLAEHGCPSVLLYVDADNAGAVRLYERAGFRSHDIDVQWQAPLPS